MICGLWFQFQATTTILPQATIHKPQIPNMSNQLIKLTLDKMGQIDSGRAMVAFQNCLQRAVQDCIDRPGVKTKRKVILEIQVWPVPYVDGNTIDCESISATIKAKCGIPQYETQELDFGFKNNGDLVFNPDSPTNHRQQTFDEMRDPDPNEPRTVDDSYMRGVNPNE